MSKSRARLLAELLNASGRVKKDKSQLTGGDDTIDLDSLPTITNAKLQNSSISIAGHSTALGGSVSLNTGDITEHTNYKYYTDARVRAAISVDGNLSYNSTTGVLSYTTPTTIASLSNHDTADLAEGTNLYFTNARARSAISASGSLSYNSSTGVLSYTQPTNISTFTNDSAYITSSANITGTSAGLSGTPNITVGTISSGAITSTGQSFFGNTSGIKGTSGDATSNVSYFSFYESDGTTRQGYIGFGSSGNQVLYVNNDQASTIILRANGNNTASVSGTALSVAGNLQISGTTVIDSSRNLTNIGTISSGAITSGAITSSGQISTTLESSSALKSRFIMGKASGSTANGELYLQYGSSDRVYIGAGTGGGAGLTVAGTLSSGAITSSGAVQAASFSDGTISGITFIDEDSFATNSATRVPTQQSIKAYVDAQVAGVVDSAPAALNTLNELAAALGDDASFSTTTSTALGNRLRVDTASQGLTGTQQANAITNLGITATKAELNYVDGVTSNIQTQLNAKMATSGMANNADTYMNFRVIRNSNSSTLNDGMYIGYGNNNSGHTRLFGGGATSGGLYIRGSGANDLTYGNNTGTIWHSANDGSGSGLDADLLDGVQGSSYLRSDGDDTTSGILTVQQVRWDTGAARYNGNPRSAVIGYSGGNYGQIGYGWVPTATSGVHTSALSDVQTRIDLHDGIVVYSSNNTAVSSGTNVTWTEILECQSNAFEYKGNTIWHAGNDGSGSGLDADTLDGINSGSFVRSDAADTLTGALTMNVGGNAITISSTAPQIKFNDTDHDDFWIHVNSDRFYILADRDASGSWETPYPMELNAGTNVPYLFGNKAWTAGNDGSGSGLDADTVDGIQAASFLRSDAADTGTTITLTDAIRTNRFENSSGGFMFRWGTNTGTSGYVNFSDTTSDPSTSSASSNAKGISWGQRTDNNPYYMIYPYYYNNSRSSHTRLRLSWHTGVEIGGSSTYGGTRFFNDAPFNGSQIMSVGDGDNHVRVLNNLYIGGSNSNIAWHAGNDGSGSGLDADLLDGINGASYLRSDTDDTYSGNLTVNGMIFKNDSNTTRNFKIQGPSGNDVGISAFTSGGSHAFQLYGTNGTTYGFLDSNWGNWDLQVTKNGGLTKRVSGGTATIWHSSNDGSGSGLDADLLDGINSSQFLRSDASDTMSGELNVTRNGGITGSSAPQYSNVNIELQTSSNNVPGISFHRGGYSATTLYEYDGELYVNAWTTRSQTGKLVSFGNDGSGSGLDADLLDGQHGSYYAKYDHFRSLGTQAFTGTASTAGLISEMEGDGAFDSYTSAFKTSWSYAGNFNMSDAGRFTETAGTAFLTWTDNSSDSARGNITVLAIAPNTGGSAGKMFVYNDQGSGYAPGWREIWTSTSDGSGSGLDADTVDGNHASAFALLGGTSHNRTIPNRWFATGDADNTIDHYTHPYAKAHMGNTYKYTTSRPAITSNSHYWIGSMGWGTIDLNTILSYGSGFWDSWGTPGNRPSTYTSHWNGFNAMHYSASTTYHHGMQMAMGAGNPSHTYLRGWWANGGSGYGWQKIWTSGNDGAGSGLDADLLDGLDSASFLRSDADDTSTGILTVSQLKVGDGNDGVFFSDSNGRTAFASGDFYIQSSVSNCYLYAANTYLGAGSGDNIYVRGNTMSGDGWSLTGAGAFTTSGVIDVNGGHGGLNITNSSILSSATSTWTGNPGGAGKIQYHSNRWYIVGDSSSNRIVQFRRDGGDKSYIENDGTFNGPKVTLSGQFAYTAPNYGHGIFGVYSATRYQHVWSMGTAYKTSADGTSYGNMYGLTFTHTNIGTGSHQAISGLGHQLQLRMNGSLYAAMGSGLWTSGNVTAYSDIAVKRNLVKIPNALEKVRSINGYTYERTDYVKDEEDPEAPDILRQAGVVAQEIEKVLPEVVSGPEGNKAVAYGNIVALLIEAIKEQQNQIEELKEIINGSNV